MIRFRAIDLETTGMPNRGGRICEIGWSDVLLSGNSKAFPCNESRLVNPFHPVPPEASAIHHLRDEDLADAPPASDVVPPVLADVDVFVAHHAEFERSFLRTDQDWICTRKVAARVIPDAAETSLQYFRYRTKLQVDPKLASPPHRAGPDAYLTARLFAWLLDHISVEKMLEVSRAPVLLYRCNVGKYRNSGITWTEVARVDREWCQWVMRNADGQFSEDVVYSAAHALRGR